MFIFATMEALKQEVKREIIADFYRKNVAKGKPHTVRHFVSMGLKKTQIYSVMQLVDAGESVAQKSGQGRPRKLSKAQERQIKKLVNNKKGPSASILASKYVCKKTISATLKRQDTRYRKKKRAPLVSKDQDRRIREACRRLSTDYYPPESSTSIVIDDESYFCLRNDALSVNRGFWTDDFGAR